VIDSIYASIIAAICRNLVANPGFFIVVASTGEKMGFSPNYTQRLFLTQHAEMLFIYATTGIIKVPWLKDCVR
jgi:hypothetical protein